MLLPRRWRLLRGRGLLPRPSHPSLSSLLPFPRSDSTPTLCSECATCAQPGKAAEAAPQEAQAGAAPGKAASRHSGPRVSPRPSARMAAGCPPAGSSASCAAGPGSE